MSDNHIDTLRSLRSVGMTSKGSVLNFARLKHNKVLKLLK